jgi:hypothetical protein
VLLTHRGPIIIDWGSACRGHPLADVARTELHLLIGKPPALQSGSQRGLLALARAYVQRTYARRYLRCRQARGERLTVWRLPRAVVRLAGALPGSEANSYDSSSAWRWQNRAHSSWCSWASRTFLESMSFTEPGPEGPSARARGCMARSPCAQCYRKKGREEPWRERWGCRVARRSARPPGPLRLSGSRPWRAYHRCASIVRRRRKRTSRSRCSLTPEQARVRARTLGCALCLPLGAEHRERARLRVARAPAQMADQRLDGLHTRTTRRIRVNHTIGVASPAVEHLVRTPAHVPAHAPASAAAGWGACVRQRTDTADWSGRTPSRLIAGTPVPDAVMRAVRSSPNSHWTCASGWVRAAASGMIGISTPRCTCLP